MIKVSVTKPIDSYMDGYCLRCNRLRTECELVRRATGKRCIETVRYTVTGHDTVELTGELFFDYANQAWVVNGKYQRCGHPDNMACSCYGRIHAGKWYTIPVEG